MPKMPSLFLLASSLLFAPFGVGQVAASAADEVNFLPMKNGEEIPPDIQLKLHFTSAPALGNTGQVRIYNAADDESVSQLHFFQWLAQALDKPLPPSELDNPDAARKRGVTNKRISNRKLKMELGHQFKYPNFRKGYSAELLRLDRAG